MALYGVVMRWFYIRISEYDIKLIDVTVYRHVTFYVTMIWGQDTLTSWYGFVMSKYCSLL